MSKIVLKYPLYNFLLYNFNTKYNIYIHMHFLKKFILYENNLVFNKLYLKLILLKHKYKHIIKSKNLVSYSNKKIRVQKGLGRARLGSLKNPVLRGGGISFGPFPFQFEYHINTKELCYIYRSLIFNKKSNMYYYYLSNNKLLFNCGTFNSYVNYILKYLGISYLDKYLLINFKNSYNKTFFKDFNSINIYDLLVYNYFIFIL